MSKKKKQFKSPNAYVVIFMVILFVTILTWFVPGGAYELDEAGNAIAGTYTASVSNPQGIWNAMMAPLIGMVGSEEISGAIIISLDIMLFCSFIEMINEVGAIKITLKRIANKYKTNFHALIWALVFVLGALGTIYGAYEEGFVYLMMFIPIILSLGMDTMVAVMIVVFGTQGGCLASIVNPFAAGIASGIAGIGAGEGMLLRTIVFVVIQSLISLYICRYADKIMKDPTKSPQNFRRAEDLKEFATDDDDLTMTPVQKKTVVVFIVTMVILIVSLIPWSTLNPNWTFFEDFTSWLTGLPVLGLVIGRTGIAPFGTWYFNEMSLLVIIASFVVGFIAHYDINKIINIIIRGAAGVVSTAFIVPMARGIQVIMTTGAITPTILHFGEETLSKLPPVLFILACMVFYFLLACLIPSSTGLAAATMSIMAPLATFAGVKVEIMIIIYAMALGMAKMIAPTSIVVMTCSQATHISYGQWVKSNWKFMVVMFAVCCLLLVGFVLV